MYQIPSNHTETHCGLCENVLPAEQSVTDGWNMTIRSWTENPGGDYTFYHSKHVVVCPRHIEAELAAVKAGKS